MRRYVESNMENIVSIIIPVYNVEKYIKRCIDSVRNQTYSLIQIILIDDGSTDMSGKICDYYAHIDTRIVVYHQENQGLAAVRNIGVRLAKGQWITFVDSDDWISPDYVEYLLSLICDNVDMAVCGAKKMWKETTLQDDTHDKVWYYNMNKALQTMLYQKKMDNNAWGKLYSAKLAKSVVYPEGYWYEDFATTYKLILSCKNVAIGSRKLYAYFQRPSSIMNSDFSEKRFELLDFAETLFDDISERFPQATQAARSRSISAFFQVLLSMPADKAFYQEQRNRIWKFIKKNRKSVLKDPKIRVKNRIAIILSYFGEDALRIVWNFITNNKKLK